MPGKDISLREDLPLPTLDDKLWGRQTNTQLQRVAQPSHYNRNDKNQSPA